MSLDGDAIFTLLKAADQFRIPLLSRAVLEVLVDGSALTVGNCVFALQMCSMFSSGGVDRDEAVACSTESCSAGSTGSTGNGTSSTDKLKARVRDFLLSNLPAVRAQEGFEYLSTSIVDELCREGSAVHREMMFMEEERLRFAEDELADLTARSQEEQSLGGQQQAWWPGFLGGSAAGREDPQVQYQRLRIEEQRERLDRKKQMMKRMHLL